VKDANGHWKTVIKDMGSVAGLPKWLAVDLTDVLAESGERQSAVGSRQLAVGSWPLEISR